jgi:hypothetical protein
LSIINEKDFSRYRIRVETNRKNLAMLFKQTARIKKQICGEFLNYHNHSSTSFHVNEMLESFQKI